MTAPSSQLRDRREESLRRHRFDELGAQAVLPEDRVGRHHPGHAGRFHEHRRLLERDLVTREHELGQLGLDAWPVRAKAQMKRGEVAADLEVTLQRRDAGE